MTHGLTTFAKETEFHGPAWMATPHKPTRLLWIVLTLLSLIACSFYCSAGVMQYIGQQSQTTYSVVHIDELELPAVEICPSARFSKAKVQGLQLSDEAADLMHLSFLTSLMPNYLTQTEWDRYGEEGLSMKYDSWTDANQNITNAEKKWKISYEVLLQKAIIRCEDVVKECRVGKAVFDGAQCCQERQELRTSSSGTCFVFKSFVQRAIGPDDGFMLRLNLNPSDSLKGLTYPYDGVSVRAVPGGKFPDPSPSFAARGERTDISVSLTKMASLPSSARRCTFSEEAKPRHHCVNECFRRQLMADCHCRPWDTPSGGAKPVCRPTELYKCFASVEMNGEAVTRLERQCNGECQSLCHTDDYKLKTTATTISDADPDDLVIHMHYDDLSYKEMSQALSITMTDLTANFGGLLGLWGLIWLGDNGSCRYSFRAVCLLGGSILAVIHALLFCVFRNNDHDKENEENASAFKDFAKETPFHGLAWVATSRKCTRATWISILVIASILCIWQWMTLIQFYFNQMPSTTYTVVDAGQIELPAIEICAPGHMRMPRDDDYIPDASAIAGLHGSFISPILASLFKTSPFDVGLARNIHGAESQWSNTTAVLKKASVDVNKTIDEIIKQASYSYNDLVLIQYVKEVAVRSQEGHLMVHKPHGLCILLPNMTQGMGGPGQGFFYRMRYYPNMGPFAPGLVKTYEGYLVRVLSTKRGPRVPAVVAAPNRRTNIAVSRINSKFLSTKGNLCANNDATVEEDCSPESLVHQLVTAKCTCRPFEYVSEAPVCFPSEMIACLAKAGITKEMLERQDQECNSKRRNKCEIEEYQVTTTHMPFSDTAVTETGRRILNESDVFIDVSYKTMREIKVSQFPRMTAADLAGNLGGSLDLWLDGSFLAALHALLFWLFRRYCTSRKDGTDKAKSSLIRRFITETPFHGPLWIGTDNKKVRGFWAILLTACIVACSLQWAGLIREFTNQPPATTYAVEEHDQLELPVIEICPPARFSTTKAAGLGLGRNEVELMHLSFLSAFSKSYATAGHFDMYYQHQVIGLMRHIGGIGTVMKAHNMTYTELMESISYNCKDLVRYCFIKGVFISGEQCCSQYQQEKVSTLGRCFRFNRVAQGRAGSGNGFEVRLKLPRHDFAFGLYYTYYGVQVRPVSGQGVPDLYPTYAPANGRTLITVESMKGRFLPTRSNPCMGGRSAGQYSYQICLYECYQSRLLQSGDGCTACRPFDFASASSAGKPICNSIELVQCFATMAISPDEIVSVEAACSRMCPRVCTVDQYDFSSTFIPFSRNLMNVVGEPAMGTDELVVDVHYKNLRQVEIQQFYSISAADLVANVGGLIGFWLGGSMFGLAHAICFWITNWRSKDIQPEISGGPVAQ